MRIHAFIFHWCPAAAPASLTDRTHRLVDLLAPHVETLTVISSGGGGPEWVNLPADAYFGHQWNTALSLFDGDILFHHQADGILCGGDYAALIADLRKAFETQLCGIYAPRVDYSAWDGPPVPTDRAAGDLHRVANTDCTCWAIHREVLQRQPRRLLTRFGWGIDTLYCEQARTLGRSVLRDYRHLIDHPRGTGYNQQRAHEEWEVFGWIYRPRQDIHRTWAGDAGQLSAAAR